VDDARELRERAFFAPVASRFKVYVIDEAHMVSPQGFNALLKLVEEPPDFVKFIFATTEPEKVLGTIKSRTHHYPFRLIPPGVLRPYLEKLCREEGVSVEPAVFPLVVRAGGGSARDSLSVLDQLIAGAGVFGVTYARAVALLGVTDVALIDEMVDALAAGDGAAAFATIDRVAEAGHDPRRFASDLLERLRDLIVLQRVADAAASGIIDGPDDQLERMTAQAARMGQATLSRMADIAHNGLTEMRGTTAPRLLLELIVARMLLPGADDSHGALLQRLERMERRLGASAEPAESPAPVREEQPTLDTEAPVRLVAPRPAAPAVPAHIELPSTPDPSKASTVDIVQPRPEPVGSLDAAAVRRVWDEILTMAGRQSKKLAAIARDGLVRDLDGDTVVLLFKTQFHAKYVADNSGPLAEALKEILGGTWHIRVELGGDERGGQRPAPSPPAESARPTEPSATSSDDGAWPETARPGGATSAPEPTADAGGNGVPPEPAKTKPSRGGGARNGPARPAAKTAPSRAPGFDPGDEPLDDATSGNRESSEEQAIRAVTEHFAVERIGDINPRA
jgi:DNA polymerase III subunit gamma/tau